MSGPSTTTGLWSVYTGSAPQENTLVHEDPLYHFNAIVYVCVCVCLCL